MIENRTGSGRWLSFVLVLGLAGCAAPNQLTDATTGDQHPVPARTGADVYDNVCHLKTSRSGIGSDGGDGSAVLYRGRYLITAAHNVSSPFYNRVTRIEIHCGERDVTGVEPDFVLTDGAWATASGYRWKRYSRDVGVIRLPRAVETAYPVELSPTDPAPDTSVEIAGYPGGDIRNAKIMYAGTGQTRASGRTGRIDYAIETATGNSGGPVWLRDGSQTRLIGIHVVGYRNGGGARRVDDWFHGQVRDMIADLDRRAE